MQLRKRVAHTVVYNLKQKYDLHFWLGFLFWGLVLLFVWGFFYRGGGGGWKCGLSIFNFSNETVRNVQRYVIISDSSWQQGRQALERISLSRSKIKFGLKHRAHLGSN